MTSHRCWFSSFCAGLVLLFTCLHSQSHPATGIVRDQQGSIFYSDLTQVWRLSTNGSKEVVVPKVHTHELCLDAKENLLGEHLWYEGDATKKWGHYVWRRSQNGKVETIIPSTAGFLANYSFVRDLAGNMYWIDREARDGAELRKRALDGAITLLLKTTKYSAIGWMTSTPSGTLYFVDGVNVVEVKNGNAKVVARNLTDELVRVNNRHKVMGLCADDTGNVWVAVHSKLQVKRIKPDGSVSVIARSSKDWPPTGVLAGEQGEIWMLEGGMPNATRVRLIKPDGTEKVF